MEKQVENNSMIRPNYDILLLYSGGWDSTLLLEMVNDMDKDVFCLIFDYGQTHIDETKAAMAYCDDNNIPYKVIFIDRSSMASSKLTDGSGHYDNVSEWHVPSRNLIFISFAAGMAEMMDIPTIWYGANYEDREHRFPDCYQEWVYQMNKVLAINGSMKIKLEAPLLGMSKSTIKSLGRTYNIDESKIFSGYGKK